MPQHTSTHHRLLALLLATSPMAHAQSTKPAPLPLEAMQIMAASFGMIRTDYVTPVDETRLIKACTRGMFKELDDSSFYLDAEAFEDLKGKRSNGSVGIGVELIQRAGLPTVLSVAEGSPAESAGLRARDHILDIDGDSMEETELAVATARVQGKPGSALTLKVRRPGEAEARSLQLVRAASAPTPVSARRWSGDIGYFRVRTMRDSTGAEIRAAFRALHEARPLKGLVLDLRQSPGGTMTSVLEIATMFLPEQAAIGRLEGRTVDTHLTLKADRAEARRASPAKDAWPEALATLPLVVLVDGGTTSGAEIVAAALRDNGRARLLGSKTFGRGSVQTVRMLSGNTAAKLTTAIYRAPAGQPFHGRGLTPDEALPDLDKFDQAGSDKDPALHRATVLLASRAG